ncbi:MAG: TonB-dependent receptor [Acidobacteria bacterium]|nr:TonB-dependent receptor [Acidobacteriota bacterium]
MYRLRRRITDQIALYLLISALAVAQLPTATILGTIKDSSGAVVPGARVEARNTDTGQTRTAISGADGRFQISVLPVGTYEVRVEQPGFHVQLRGGVVLTIGREAVVSFTLELGPVEQTVSVTADAPAVTTTSGSLGGLVDEQKVSGLPLNGRNYIDLTLLQPGVQEHKNTLYTAGMTGTWFSSNGAPLRSNNYLLDGAPMVNIYGATSASITGSTLGIEGIREYRVATNSFPAEYGMTMGSQVVVATKNGTSEFHGSMFEYLRNAVLDARNFFDRRTPTTPYRLPPFKRNNFGASLGGPIWKEKTFLQAVYEGLRERLGVTSALDTIPSTARLDGGRVPVIAPVIRPLLTLYPEPNLPNDRYTFPFSQPTREDYGQVRVDEIFSERDTSFARYTTDDAEQTRVSSYPQFKDVLGSRAQYASLADNHVFSPRLLNVARFSYSRTRLAINSPIGISGPEFSFVPGREIGSISIGGVSNLGADSSTPMHHKQNIFTWSDDLFYTPGRQSLKIGALINRYQQYMLMSAFARGTVNFADLNSFLLARPSSYNAVTRGSILDRTYAYSTLGFYVQDDVRVAPRVTLNLGLRYEFLTQIQEIRGYGAALRDIQHDEETTKGVPFRNPSLRNLSPRFGFAWDVNGNGRMALRGGFALLYDIGNLGTALSAENTAMPPFSSRSTVSGPTATTLFSIPFFFPSGVVGRSIRLVDYSIQQPHLLQYNFTVERQLPSNVAVTLAYAGSRGINLVTTTEGNPRVPQVLSDGRQYWAGTESRMNPFWADIELHTANGNSWYNSLQIAVIKSLSNGLQFQSSYTWSKTIDETQSQLNPENTASSSFPSDPTHRTVDRGLASFDAAHNWRFNANYRLPYADEQSGAGKILSGWWVSGIASVQSGYPFSPTVQANRSRSGVAGGRAGIDRPNLVADRSASSIVLGGPDRYFDAGAFVLQPAGFLGTAGRNILRGPGFATVDFALAKDTAAGFLGDGGRLEFRAEFFNILNRANFLTPGIGLGGNSAAVVFAGNREVESTLTTAGRIGKTVGTSRQIQFALKILF